MLREWFFGITSEWPRVHGLMSMNASVLSSSSILCEGISPATILQKRQSGSFIEGGRLQPVDAPEEAVEREAQDEHHRNRRRVAEAPVELGHVAEVHAVDAGDQRRNGDDRGPRGDLAHLLVLAHRDLREVRLEDARQ